MKHFSGLRYQWRVLIFVLALGVGAFAIVAATIVPERNVQALRVGQVAPIDYTAPTSTEYISQVLTEQAQQAAERAVAPVYASPDPAIARQQLERLRATLDYITLVRADALATPEQKQSSLQNLRDVALSNEQIVQILALSDQRWEILRQEALNVLEQVMRNPIRDEDLPAMRESVTSRVSLALPDDQARLVAHLVKAFVAANRLFSPEETEAARQAAREAVAPVVKRYVAGEIVVQRGEVITAEVLEALQQMGLVGSLDARPYYFGSAALIAVLMLVWGLYLLQKKPEWMQHFKNPLAIWLLYLAFLGAERWLVPGHVVLPFAFPLAAFALLMQALFGTSAALMLALWLALPAAYNLPGMLHLTAFYLFTALGGALALGRARRVGTYLRAGVVITLMGVSVLIAYRIPFLPLDENGLVTLLGVTAVNGIASAGLAFLLQYFLGLWLNRPTPIHLLEFARPDMPLLQLLLHKAPGTYQHSLQVANLAEQAAEAIGADALLTRVGALYHDIGKTENPGFFIENQLGTEVDTHDDMDPYQAAEQIIRHVTDGVRLARRYRLPERLQDFIREHHGTMLTRYQYNLAFKAAANGKDTVDIARFRYPGPEPRSRETALLMLADGTEARVRAMRPASEEEVRKIVHDTIQFVRENGQLDYVPLTQRDLAIVAQTFVDVLRSTYHPRVRYPQKDAQK